jgi:hypothetical protein
MKTIWFISGFVFLCGFYVVAPIMKILHWNGADYAFLVAAFFGLIFIPITLTHFYKKFK